MVKRREVHCVWAALWGMFFGSLVVVSACEEQPPAKCNDFEHLCDRSLEDITFVHTHNSHSTEEDGFDAFALNHLLGIPRQLRDGVRSFNVDVYRYEWEVVVCHGSCVLGSRPFLSVLQTFVEFMEKNPREVIMLALQQETTNADIIDIVEQSGLEPFLHSQPVGALWPTLRELIDSGRRFIFFGGSNEGSRAWYHNAGSYMMGTPWEVNYPEDLGCEISGAVPEHKLLKLVHTMIRPFAQLRVSEEINYNPFLEERVAKCTREWGRKPNFISVDFYSHSDVFSVVEELNAPD